MNTNGKKVFDLSARRDPVAGIIEVNGARHNVLKLNGVQYQQMTLLDDSTPATRLYGLVGEVVPTLPQDEVLQLDKDQCGMVLMIAGQGIETVERLFPNAPRPEPESTTSPG